MRADFAAHLIQAWAQVSDGAVRRGWESFDPDTGFPQAQLQNALAQ
jgi:hypothetical protein